SRKPCVGLPREVPTSSDLLHPVSDYRETAAKFQKEWHVKEPHQDFTFAPYVKSHALVSVINRGLLYHALERQRVSDQQPAKVEEDGAAAAAQPRLLPPPPPATHTSGPPAPPPLPSLVASGDEGEFPRKRSQKQQPNGSPGKRPRLSNGYENGTSETAAAAAGGATTPMDLDSHDHQHQNQDNNHAYPSPLEGEEVTTPAVHTEGPERGTQLDKVDELTPDTTFVQLADYAAAAAAARSPRPSSSSAADGSSSSSTTTITTTNGTDAANAPTLLHCQWNPKEPSSLAASGTGALARVWTVSRVPASETEPAHDHVAPSAFPLLDPATPVNTVVSQLTWASDGSNIALVAEQEGQSLISIYSADGALVQAFDVALEQVIKLCWNPANSALLAISPSSDDADPPATVLTVCNAFTGESLSYTLSGHDMNTGPPLDAAWTGDSEFVVAGGDILVSLYCTESGIFLGKRFETRPDDSIRNILFDRRSKLAATSSDKGTLDLWDESGQRRSISAHQGAITAMEWQPLPNDAEADNEERLIATGGEDCAILIWNARMPESKPRSFLTMDSPIVNLAFTPDGAFIAGATASQVLIWKVGNPIAPRAVWKRTEHPGWLSPKVSSGGGGHEDTLTSEEEGYAEHCLAWDALGQRLAYGSNSRLAVINWSR
ncbi:WD40 repeat, partial [Geosmithia morbida]